MHMTFKCKGNIIGFRLFRDIISLLSDIYSATVMSMQTAYCFEREG